MIRTLSETVVLPIAGIILTFVMCYELINIIIERNNMSDFDTFIIYKWIFKTFIAVFILTNTFNIVVGVFELAQSVINDSAAFIVGDLELGNDAMMDAMKGSMTHTAALGDDAGGNITRINNAFDRIPQRLISVEERLETLCQQQKNAQAELGKPFEREQEMTDKQARLDELNSMLDLDKQPQTVIMDDVDNETADVITVAAKTATPMGELPDKVSAKGKPSLLESLDRYAEKSKAMFNGGTDKPKREDIIE